MTYSIGDISKMCDIPVSTLRYYDSEGLLPDLQRKSGIRIFTDRELDQLRMIECLKKSGLKISEIRQFMEWAKLGSSTYQQRYELMKRQLESIENQIAEMRKVQAMVQYKCWYYSKAIEDGNEDGLKEMMPDQLPEDIQKLYDLAHDR